MELKIAIVEDNTSHQEKIAKVISRWSLVNCSVQISVFASAGNFLEISKSSNEYQLIILDIELKDSNINGIEIAKILRQKYEYRNDILFLTSHKQFVFEGYNVHALNYLIKPISYNKLAQWLDFVKRKFQDDTFQFSIASGIVTLPYSSIIYLSAAGHYIEIKTQKDKYQYRELMSKVEARLPSSFARCHRSVIVNFDYILKFVGKEITLTSGEIIPVSNKYLPNLQSLYCDLM